MTLNLTYNDDLSRVQVSVTGLPFATGTIRVERSMNQVLWQTVRGASELPVSGNAAAVDDYEFAADVQNFYRVVPIDPVAGLYLSGNAGSYASTPDHASLDITGDIDLRAEAALDDWSSGIAQVLMSRYDSAANDRSFALQSYATGAARFWRSANGSTTTPATSSVLIPAANGARKALRLDYASATGNCVFSTAAAIDGTWTQLGSTQATAPSAIYAGSAPLEVGSWALGTAGNTKGIVFAAEFRNGIGGTVVADPRFDEQAMDAASFTDSTGKLWTINGDAYLVGTETASITPSLAGRTWLKSIRHPFLNRALFKVLAVNGQEISRSFRGGVHDVAGRSVPVAVTDVRGSKSFAITVQAENEDAAAVMDLVLASGDVFFLHVPPEMSPHVQGGYVLIGDESQHRPADTVRWRFTLPCRVVVPPGPGVVGTTLTWGTVMNLFGSWEALLAAYPTWSDLLQTVGSPEDLVVV